MWTPDPSNIITAAQKAREQAAADRLAQFPNLEPDQFWFVVRASGYEPELLAWVEAMKDEPSPANWAAASAKLQFAKFFERDHPFVEEAREAMGILSSHLDALWAYGADQ